MAAIVRNIVHIDEEKCNGCGVCALACAEGALKIIDGKAKLISETYCDGLGACLGECPQGAITIEKREATDFSEAAVHEHLAAKKAREALPCGCPGSSVSQWAKPAEEIAATTEHQPTQLRQWPVQLALVPPTAPFLKGADLVLAADCVPFAYAGFHRDFLKGRALLVACPKLDNFPAHQAKLNAILSQADVKSLTVVHMEVPCCSGLVHMAKQAVQASGKNIPMKEVTISTHGEQL